MDAVKLGEIITKIVSGGPTYWIAGGVGLLLFIAWKLWSKGILKKAQDQAAEQQRQADQSTARPINQQASQDWRDAEERNEAERERIRREMSGRNQP